MFEELPTILDPAYQPGAGGRNSGFDQIAEIRRKLATPDEILFAISTALCVSILILTGWIWSVKKARSHLRRVSFRLMVWALAFQVGYNVFRFAMLVRTISTEMQNRIAASSYDKLACAVVTTLFFQCLNTVNFLITCIAINLALITCLGVNPIQLGLEKWYLAGSIALGVVLPIIPASLGHFGADPLYGFCYISVADRKRRFEVVMAELVMWNLLSCVVAFVAVGAAVFKLIHQSRVTKQIMRANMRLLGSDDLGAPTTGDVLADDAFKGTPTSSDPNNQPTSTSAGTPVTRPWRIFRQSTSSSLQQYGQLHDRVAGIAWRISLYPISLIVINIVRNVGDVYFNDTISEETPGSGTIALYVIYRLVNSGRGIVLALLCLIFDPCLKRGLGVAWQDIKSSRGMTTHEEPPLGSMPSFMQQQDDDPKRRSFTSLRGFMNIPILVDRTSELPDNDVRRPSDQSAASVDITTALRGLPSPATISRVRYDDQGRERARRESEVSQVSPILAISPVSRTSLSPEHHHDPSLSLHAPFSPARPRQRSPSRSFAGVARDALPPAMTDEVDADLRLTYTPVRPRFVHRYSSRDGSSENRESLDVPEAWEGSPQAGASAYPRRLSRFTLPPALPEDADQDVDDAGTGEAVSGTPGLLVPTDTPLGTVISLNSPTTPAAYAMPKSAALKTASPQRLVPTFARQLSCSLYSAVSASHDMLGLAYSPRSSRFAPTEPIHDTTNYNVNPTIDDYNNDIAMPMTASPLKNRTPLATGRSDDIPMQPLQALRAKAASRLSLPLGAMASAHPIAAALASPFKLTSERRRPVSYLPPRSNATAGSAASTPSPIHGRNHGHGHGHGQDHYHERLSVRKDTTRAIPTAPLPSRLLERRQQRRAEMAAEARRQRGEEADETERKLAELEIQL